MKFRGTFLALSVFCFLGFWYACTSTKDASRTAPPELSADEQKKLDEMKAEIEVGRNMAGRLLAFYGSVDDPKLISYVNQVGSYVAQNSDFPDRRFMFNILDNDKANAFACPGGYILITKGAIKLAENEAELAAILAHEISHVGRRHLLNTLKNMNEKELEAAAEAIEKKSQLPESIQVRKREDPGKNTAVAGSLARVMSGTSASGLGIFKAASAGMGLLLEKGLDKKLEFEADQDGVKFAVNAGYHPDGLRQFLKRLESQKEKVYSKILADTHPTTQDRVSRISKQLQDMKAPEIIGATGVDRFKKITKNVETAEKTAKADKVDKPTKSDKPAKSDKTDKQEKTEAKKKH